jgi:hypothetical protein
MVLDMTQSGNITVSALQISNTVSHSGALHRESILYSTVA